MTTNATSNFTPEAGIPQGESLVFSVPECAKTLQISTSLCYKLCRSHKIPGTVFLGSRRMVVSRAAILDFLSKGAANVVLVYEGYKKPTPLGLTDNPRLKVLVKRQLIKEAMEALRGAEVLGDDVLIASFQSSVDRLRKTLDLLIPTEFEGFYLVDVEDYQ